MKRHQLMVTALITALLLPTCARAQSHAHAHHPASHQKTHRSEKTKSTFLPPSTRDYQAANADMHRRMDVKFTHDADRDFAQGMIPHHQGAVDMARVVIKYGKDPFVRDLALKIIQNQGREIGQLTHWLNTNGMSPAPRDSSATAEYQAANARMHAAMAIPLSGDADRDFVAGMIPHHQGAVDMAKTVKKYGVSPFLHQFADKVIQDQQAEIRWMQGWLAQKSENKAGSPSTSQDLSAEPDALYGSRLYP